MIKPRILPECNRCEFYGRSQYLICAIHPTGCPDNQCLDFRPAPDVEQELWAPTGFSWYGNDQTPNPPSKLSRGDRDGIDVLELETESMLESEFINFFSLSLINKPRSKG